MVKKIIQNKYQILKSWTIMPHIMKKYLNNLLFQYKKRKEKTRLCSVSCSSFFFRLAFQKRFAFYNKFMEVFRNANYEIEMNFFFVPVFISKKFLLIITTNFFEYSWNHHIICIFKG